MKFTEQIPPTHIVHNIDTGTDYLFYTTQDGSPSLVIRNKTSSHELMHSMYGAWSETVYLYEPVLQYAFEQKAPPKFLCVGLGLGYIELLSVGFFLSRCKKIPDEFCIDSFEIIYDLNNFFSGYCLEQNIPKEFFAVYEYISDKVCEKYSLDIKSFKAEIKKLIETNKIKLCGEFKSKKSAIRLRTKIFPKARRGKQESTQWTFGSMRRTRQNRNTAFGKISYAGVFFDAFSAGSTPLLWADETLNLILKYTNTICSFATYASRSSLKQILSAHSFSLEKKSGYGNKKQSTFAFRAD